MKRKRIGAGDDSRSSLHADPSLQQSTSPKAADGVVPVVSSSSAKAISFLGASEFAAVLNQGDDPRAVWNCLKRFSQTVRLQRKIALSSLHTNQNEDEDDDPDEDAGSKQDDIEGGPNETATATIPKKYRKNEEWKADTAQYHVPFVGTAVSEQHHQAQVVEGLWPTGLLETYLQKSPLAVELTSDALVPGSPRYKLLFRRKQGKVAYALHKAHLVALSELITAAIPIDKLVRKAPTAKTGDAAPSDSIYLARQDQSNQGPTPSKFIGEILKKRLPGLLLVLKDETGNGKGKPGPLGGCGALAPCILRILSRLALVSSWTAREVARTLEQNLPEGLLRWLLRPSPHHTKHSSSADVVDVGSSKVETTPRDRARIETLNLATALLEADDSIILSCIATPGIKDRKIPPGILYLALQAGLDTATSSVDPTTHQPTSAFFKAAAKLLCACRKHLISNAKKMSNRTLFDVLSRDGVQNIGRLALLAPPLSDAVPFTHVLNGATENTEGSMMMQASVEARRLTFLLLANVDSSPLLYAVEGKDRRSSEAEQILLKCMVLLLDQTSGLQMQLFMVHVINTSPRLWSGLFRVLTFPDSKGTFPFITRLGFVARLYRQGPTVQRCFAHGSELVAFDNDQLILGVLPLGLKKQPINKALQSSNQLVVSETLKLVLFAMERFRTLVSALGSDKQRVDGLSEALAICIPDVQIVVGIISRLDSLDQKANAVVLGYACDLIRKYTALLPFTIRENKFDWVKILGADWQTFQNSPIWLQRTMLLTFGEVFRLHSDSSKLAGWLHRVLEIVLRTQYSKIYLIARKLGVAILAAVESNSANAPYASNKAELEAATWIDALSLDTLDDFTKVVQESFHLRFRAKLHLAKAWKATGRREQLPDEAVSPLIIQSCRVSSQMSPRFVHFCCQVISKWILSLPDQKLLAALLVYSFKQVDTTTDDPSFLRAAPLVGYAAAILRGDSPKLPMPSALALSQYYFPTLSPTNAPPTLRQGGKSIRTELTRLDSFHYTRLLSLLSVSCGDERADWLDRLCRHLPVAIRVLSNAAIVEVLGRLLSGIDNNCLYQLLRIKLVAISSREQELQTFFSDVTRWSKTSELAPLQDVFLLLITSFLAPPSNFKRLGTILELVDVTKDPNVVTLELTSIQILVCMEEFGDLSIDWKDARQDTKKILETWLNLTRDRRICDKRHDLRLWLERFLCRLLSKRGEPSVFSLYAAVSSFEPCILIDAGLASLSDQNNAGMKNFSGGILPLLIRCDQSRLSPFFLEQVASDRHSRMLQSGLLDEALLVAMTRPENLIQHTSQLELIARCLINRASLLSIEFLNESETLLHLLLLVSQSGEENRLATAAVIGNFLHLMRSEAFERVELAPMMAFVRVCLCLTVGICATEEFSSAILSVLIFLSERSLRQHFKEKKNLNRTNVTGDPVQLLGFLCSYLDEFSKGELAQTDLIFNSRWEKLAQLCLRHGIDDVIQENLAIKAACISLVKRFALALIDARGDQADDATGLKLCSIFDLATSHSKFVDLLNSCGELVHLKLQVVELLYLCLSYSKVIPFIPQLCSTFFSVFGAGTSRFDRTLRLVLELYISLVEEFCPDQIRLRDSSLSVGKGRWDWLVDVIEMKRVYATLRKFPIEDPMLTLHGSGDSKDTAQFLFRSSLSGDVDDDQRYSPGFLLPLFLAALEGCSSAPLIAISKDMNPIEDAGLGSRRLTSDELPVSVQMLQRICDKGVVALSLASLSSACGHVRRTAAAIVGVLSVLIGSKTAVMAANWRERPQIAMLLNSVRRAMVVRAKESGLGADSPELEVVRLPGVSAIFLARAALILSRPIDPLYSTINRYFLKSDCDHGAFQDLTRMPAFIAMFFSSAESLEQTESERAWCLEFICEGMLDEASCKAFLSCHAPEHMLSHLDSVGSVNSSSCERELVLVLSGILRALEKAGRATVTHFVGRLGLVAWLRSYCLTRELAQVLPSIQLRTVFADLCKLTVQHATKVSSPSNLYASTAGIANAVVELAAYSLDEVDKIYSRQSRTSPEALFTSTCDLLSLLSEVNPDCLDYDLRHASAVDLKASTFFLASRYLPIERRPHATLSFCCLPCRMDFASSALATQVCKQILSVGADQIRPAMFDRVAEISRFYGALDSADDIIRSALLLRVDCGWKVDCRDSWFACMATLLKHASVEDDVVQIAKEILATSC